jgi:hypothetical protein
MTLSGALSFISQTVSVVVGAGRALGAPQAAASRRTANRGTVHGAAVPEARACLI